MRLSTACLVCTLASVLLLAPLGGAAPRPLTLDLQRYDEYSTTVARVTLTQIEPTLSAIRNQGDSIAVVYGWNDMACADV